MNQVIELDEFNFHTVLSEAAGISLVFFSGPHCSSCHHLKHLLNTEFQQFTGYFLDFSAFEIKADKAAALVNEFGVFHLPSVYIYRDGEYHCELQAESVPSKIIEAIEAALLKPAEEEP
jgi:thioredoxin-like negative regulator of GroEL